MVRRLPLVGTDRQRAFRRRVYLQEGDSGPRLGGAVRPARQPRFCVALGGAPRGLATKCSRPRRPAVAAPGLTPMCVRASTGSVYSESLRPTLSMQTVDSRRSTGGYPATTSVYSASQSGVVRGNGLARVPRRYTSRQVPQVAEEIAQSQVLTEDMIMRFNGLMRHLRGNSEWEEQTKQVMYSNMELLVPEEYDDILYQEFGRRCSIGERANTEFMSSAKWVRLLRDADAITPCPSSKRGPPLGTIEMADADVVFHKVLHDCDYGCKRLNYEYFCKALYLVARAIRPDLDSDEAFKDILARIAAQAPEELHQPEEVEDYMLDVKVLLVLDDFKPPLFDLFRTFCHRHLGNAAGPSHGPGAIRIRERTFWKRTQDTIANATAVNGLTGTIPCRTGTIMSRGGGPRSSSQASTHLPSSAGTGGCEDGQRGSARSSSMPPAIHTAFTGSEADAGGGGYATDVSWSPQLTSTSPLPNLEEKPPLDRPHSLVDGLPGGSAALSSSAILAPGNTIGSASLRATGTLLDASTLESANGAPVIRNRRSHMSIDQLLHMCRELKVVPDLLTRIEVIQVFKRAQCGGNASRRGSSIHDYLSQEAFVDAFVQMAMKAYSKPPFCEQYPAPSEKIFHFALAVLPVGNRELMERYHYGCAGRGR